MERERENAKFRERYALPDENDDAATSVQIIVRENARPECDQIAEQRIQESGKKKMN